MDFLAVVDEDADLLITENHLKRIDMNQFKSIIPAIAVAAALSGLAGCGSAPGDSQVREALTRRILSAYATMFPSRLITAKDKKEVEDSVAKVKVAGCKKADAREGFDCDWSGSELASKIVGNSGRVFKTDSGWTVAKIGD